MYNKSPGYQRMMAIYMPQAVWARHTVCTSRREMVIAYRILAFLGSILARLLRMRSRWILIPWDRKCPQIMDDPTKHPCSCKKFPTLLSSSSSLISSNFDKCSNPNSATLRWIVQRDTNNIPAISFQLKPSVLSSIRVFSLHGMT